MDTIFCVTGEKMTVYLEHDIDHHNSQQIRAQIDTKINDIHPHTLVLNFGGVEFMDSSGIGLILGRSKLMSEIGGEVVIDGLTENLKKLIDISGLAKIVLINEETTK
ncbi:MAG: anti-sigma factor antagonist [Oscillospiraceae bacterium]